MVCMEHFQHFVKERLSLKLESAMPAVDQPVGEVDKREVDKMLLLYFTMLGWFHSCHAVLFY